MNKKGIELSTNFLVMLILGIVILGFGIKFTWDAFFKAEAIKHMSQDQLDNQLEQLSCGSAERTCIGQNSKKFDGKNAVYFTLSVFNDGSVKDANENVITDFSTSVELYSCLPEVGSGCPSGYDGGIINSPPINRDILPNKQQSIVIGIYPEGAPKGTYIYTITVLLPDGSKYDTAQMIYVVV